MSQIAQDIKATAGEYRVLMPDDSGQAYAFAITCWRRFPVGHEAEMAQQVLAEVTARWPDEHIMTTWSGDILMAVYSGSSPERRGDHCRAAVEVRNHDGTVNRAWFAYAY